MLKIFVVKYIKSLLVANQNFGEHLIIFFFGLIMVWLGYHSNDLLYLVNPFPSCYKEFNQAYYFVPDKKIFVYIYTHMPCWFPYFIQCIIRAYCNRTMFAILLNHLEKKNWVFLIQMETWHIHFCNFYDLLLCHQFYTVDCFIF